MGFEGEERRANIGENCDLYGRCLQMSTGWELFAKEVSQVKDEVNSIKKSEAEATKMREETQKLINVIASKLDKHIDDFQKHGSEEMETVRTQTKAITKLSDDHTKLLEAVTSISTILAKTTEETDHNTELLTQQQKDREIAQAIEEALEAEKEPYKEYKKKAILVAVSVVTLAVIGGVWKLFMFVVNLNTMVNGG